MASNQSSSPSGVITSINVTPLVDITLVLLIIFMVTAKLIVSHTALPVELPKAASGSEVQEVFSIDLAVSGEVQVNGEKLGQDDAIGALARAAQAKNKDVRAVIKADGRVNHSRVMHVLDILKLAGVSRIGFGVLPEPEPSSSSKSP
jgi:biopolymer transport protein ExbD